MQPKTKKTPAQRRASGVGSGRMVRVRRLRKIAAAQLWIEDSLLELRKVGNPTLQQDRAFGDLYYLIRLAKRAP